MEVDLIFKIAAIGILVAVLNQRIRSIITRNQRALSGPFPDSAQISTVSKIGQSCRHGRQR